MLPLKIVHGYLDGLADNVVDAEIHFKQGLNNEELVLTKPFHAYGQTAPAGFVFNGASSPRFAWFVIPRFYKMLKASCYHDHACEQARCWWDRLLADIVFFIMAYYIEKLALWRCLLGLAGVRIGAFFGVGKNY